MSEHVAADSALNHDDATVHPGVPYDPMANRIGMWLFLFTEVLLFGTLFICYAVYLHMYTWQFEEGSEHLSVWAGAINTVVLLTSSLTMALAIATMERSKKEWSIRLLNITLLFALTFLIIKAFEWGGKFEHGIYPGSAHLLEDFTKGENVFFGLYFTMTGLHGLHVLIGMALILFVRHKIIHDKVTRTRISWLDNAGLYWHLVDLIWIYLFPLFYLIG